METFFQAKRVCVIGASGVLGSEFARQVRGEGANVSLIARNVSAIPSDLQSLPSVSADIRDRASLAFALAELGNDFDGLFNAAGVVAFGSVGEVPADIASELFEVNAVGTMNVLALGATRVSAGGFIASLTGVAADMDLINMSAYCASKSAAKAAMRIAARELRAKKITVLDVRAPHTETGLVNRALFGVAPTMPPGQRPHSVVTRILTALANGEKDLPAEAFSE